MKKSILLTVCLTVSVGMMLLTSLSVSPAAEATDSDSNTQYDLVVQIPVPPGFDGTPYQATIPGLELYNARIIPSGSDTRVSFRMKFVSRKVNSAYVKVELLDKYDGKVLYQKTHEENLGPERVVRKGPTLDSVSTWDDYRAIWINFPKDADKATAIRLCVRVYREPDFKDF